MKCDDNIVTCVTMSLVPFNMYAFFFTGVS